MIILLVVASFLVFDAILWLAYQLLTRWCAACVSAAETQEEVLNWLRAEMLVAEHHQEVLVIASAIGLLKKTSSKEELLRQLREKYATYQKSPHYRVAEVMTGVILQRVQAMERDRSHDCRNLSHDASVQAAIDAYEASNNKR